MVDLRVARHERGYRSPEARRRRVEWWTRFPSHGTRCPAGCARSKNSRGPCLRSRY